MPALPKRRRRKSKVEFKENKKNPQSSNFLIILLTLIVLFETVVILSFISKKSPLDKIKKVKVSTKKTISEPVKITPVTRGAKEVFEEPGPYAKNKGQIAIVIDDWGYSKQNLEILKEIDSPLTLAILPFRDYSREIADFAHNHDYEVIIHMPMEPEDKQEAAMEPKTLMAYMSRSTINYLLDEAFDNIKYAKGISNHMGSYATQKKPFMKMVLKRLKRNDCYFLDSYVTAASVAGLVAKELAVKFAQRSVFLDNESDPRYIRGQLSLLAAEARKNGKAVGIGHDRVNTLFTLKEEIPKLARQGYRFVFVSEVVE